MQDHAARGSQPRQRCRQRRRLAPLAATAGDEGDSSGIPDSLPVFSKGSDWRTVRAQLVASTKDAGPTASTSGPWAHMLPAPEQGCLLLANPIMFQVGGSQQWLVVSWRICLDVGTGQPCQRQSFLPPGITAPSAPRGACLATDCT